MGPLSTVKANIIGLKGALLALLHKSCSLATPHDEVPEVRKLYYQPKVESSSKYDWATC